MRTSLTKKIVAVLLVLTMMLPIAACAAEAPAPGSAPASSAAASSETPVSSEPAAPPVELIVLAAASLTDVLTEIAGNYKTVAPNVTVTFSFAASGALQTQIEEGAPADLFFSAAQKQMDALADKDLIIVESRKDMLVNKLVMIVPKDSPNAALTFEDAATDKVKKIGLGDPASVPVGQYAEEAYTSLNLLDAIKSKAVYGSDVRTVLTWVETGEVDAGVVYSTDAAVSDSVIVSSEAPADSYKKIVYPAALIKSTANPEAAQAFLDYLSAAESGALFVKYGFTLA